MTIKYLIEDGNGDFYTIVSSALSGVTVADPVTAADFAANGFDSLVEIDLAKTLAAPKIHKWNDSAAAPFALDVTGSPAPQTIIATIDFTDPDISGIDSFTQTSTGAPTIAFSADAGVSWYSYIGGEWIDASTDEMELALVTNLTGAIMTTLIGAAENFQIRITLNAGDSVDLFRAHFMNTTQ